MRNLALPVALTALAVAPFAVVRLPRASALADAGLRDYPPLIFTSRALLECSISSTKPGRQIMHTIAGQGFDFDMSMVPIKDGLVKVQAPGMRYKFTAFPSGRIPAEFKGLGKGTILEMKAEVGVDVNRFAQPGGLELRFGSALPTSTAMRRTSNSLGCSSGHPTANHSPSAFCLGVSPMEAALSFRATGWPKPGC
jgi:hypothetical protein